VVNGSANDAFAQSQLGDQANADIARAADVARHMAKLSANLLMPQMAKGDEDQADALGFDLLVKAGYDPEAPLAVMDKLAEQEAEAAAAPAAPEAATQKNKGGDSGGFMNKVGGGLSMLGTIAAGGRPSNDQIADI